MRGHDPKKKGHGTEVKMSSSDSTQISATGTVKRVLALRLKPGTDMLTEIEKACNEHQIKNGVIISGIGSVGRAAFCDPQYFPDRKQPYNYGPPIIIDTHLSIASISGIVCHDDDGTNNVHVHVTFSDEEGRCYAGHLKEGTRVLLTVDMMIAEVEGIDMTRKMDEELEVPIFCPVQA